MRNNGSAICVAGMLAWAAVTGCGGGGAPATFPPVAFDDAISTPLDTAVNFDVTANDIDPEGRALEVTILTPPSGGTLVQVSDGTLTYTPPAAFSGFQSFTYEVTDDQGLTDTATATLIVDVTIQVQITGAKGLFTPNAEGVGEYQAAYASADDLGRVYSNRIYDPGNPTVTVWTKDRQYVDLAVDVLTGGIALPAEARVVWQVEDPDDPSNEDPLTHAEAGDTLDPNDYDGRDNDDDGTADNSDGDDNSGSRDGLDVWEELDVAHALSEGNATAISSWASSVRFNATDDGGDNFILKAGLRLSAKGEPLDLQSTGVITTWKRVDVEYVKMTSAAPLTGLVDGAANDAFAKAFVEVVSAAARDVADIAEMGVNRYAAGNACDLYVTSAGEFQHEGDPGWFFAAAANHFVDTGGGGGANLWEGSALALSDGLTMGMLTNPSLAEDDRFLYGSKLGSLALAGGYRVMKTDIDVAQADLYADGTVLYNWNGITGKYESSAPIISHTTGNDIEITYGAAADAADGPILIYKTIVSAVVAWDPNGVGPFGAILMYENFSWNPASETFRVWPQGYSTPTSYNNLMFNLHGYGFPSWSTPWTRVLGTGATYVAGISPGPNGGLEGRTMVFTAAGGDLNVLIHEFGHAFGFHHICGNWDHRSDDNDPDSAEKRCCTMHYSSMYFMLNHANPRRPVLWNYANPGPYFCEEHAVVIRRQNLEDLSVLGWGN